MQSSRNIYVLFLIFSLVPMKQKAFIEGLEVWQKDGQYIFILGDRHIVGKEYNSSQRETIHQILSSSQDTATSTQVIVEDIMDYSPDTPDIVKGYIADNLDNSPASPPQIGLSRFCKSHGIPVTNVEYRFSRIAPF